MTNDMIYIRSLESKLFYGWCNKEEFQNKKINFMYYYLSSGQWLYIKLNIEYIWKGEEIIDAKFPLHNNGDVFETNHMISCIVLYQRINWKEEMIKDQVPEKTIKYIESELKKKQLNLFKPVIST